jgi:hypothetical protein
MVEYRLRKECRPIEPVAVIDARGTVMLGFSGIDAAFSAPPLWALPPSASPGSVPASQA